MKGTSKVVMGATLVMVLSLAIVLGLVLVLLAELYCSILLRRRRLKTSKTSNTTTATAANTSTSQTEEPPPGPSPLSSFYSQGVLHAPRSFLFPKLPSKREQIDDNEKHHCKFHHFLSIQTQELSPPQPRLQTSPSPSYIPLPKPRATTEEAVLDAAEGGDSSGDVDRVCCGDIGKEELVYISNPIYDNDANRPGRADATPFETPDTSPSRLRTGGSLVEDEITAKQPTLSSPSSSTLTPPLTPMKELPTKACSVALRDASSLATSGSDSNSRNGASSSSSGTPCTSPSW